MTMKRGTPKSNPQPLHTQSPARVRELWKEFERLGWFLGRIGPDEMCCGSLTRRQCAILRVLTCSGGERLSDLAQAIGLSPSGMTRVLERLEKQGLLSRVHGGMQDGRESTISITVLGRETRALLDQIMIQKTEAILTAIPIKSRSVILKAIRELNCAFEVSGCCGLDPVESLRTHKVGRNTSRRGDCGSA